jgi:DNA-binding transcriptional ArsR family regulator
MDYHFIVMERLLDYHRSMDYINAEVEPMNFDPLVSEVASLISEQSRSTILLTLLDGRRYTVSELAVACKITPQTASFHLTKMRSKGIVLSEKIGRHKYISLASSEVASILEKLLTLTEERKPNSFKEVSRLKEIHFARTCYDHLAGRLGVELTNSLLENNYIVDSGENFELTPLGEAFFDSVGMELSLLKRKRRAFTCKCLDWSERKFHLAGALGNSLLLYTLEENWIERIPSTRAIRVTNKGMKGFKDVFGIII